MSNTETKNPLPSYETYPGIQQPQPVPLQAVPPQIAAYQQQTQQHPQHQAFYQPVLQLQHQSGYATATPLQSLQRVSAPVDCPVCGQREMTRVEAATGNTTHAWAALLCCCCCLGCIPYLMTSLKDADHYCGKCGAQLATWHKSGRVELLQTGQR